MLKKQITTALTACMILLSGSTTAKIVHLMPTPKEISLSADGTDIDISNGVRLKGASQRLSKAAEILLGVEITEDSSAPEISILYTNEATHENDYSLYGFDYEGYTLNVDNDKISIVAANETGAIRAMQTLAQMAEGWNNGEKRLETCTIKDYPAFKLRGYMHDVGRSFIPFEELKKQIVLFARYKVNVFHFHLTENQAWRFEVKSYPQLTSTSSMTRLPGMFYTQEQCREIDELAYTLGMTVIPEIDMPGHSDAFERAMGHTMQTTKGIAELKTILEEVAATFTHAPYIHIGADETTITYPQFLKTMSNHIHSLGKQVVVWNPASGVAISKDAGADMTQMWSTAGKAVSGIPNIDCRYNYINHFDLFADLVGIYKSNIYYADKGSEEIAGEITAVWNDRNLPSHEDIMRQNNVYASVLASAERAWKGGGKKYIEQGGTTLPNEGDEFEEFRDWETRFLFHKENSLKDEPISYVRQTDIVWNVTDAFPNGGNMNMQFPPETDGEKQSYTYNGKTYNVSKATGAGIYLRHTWGTTVPAFYDSPEINHTAYAWTYVYSQTEQTAGALIEFQNYSRSEQDITADNGKWDRKGSRLWINGNEIIAPDWDNAGKTINKEMLQLNENCTARPPMQITLKQGWNKIFMKLPYVNTPGVRLNKWMFTFAITDTEGRNALDNIVYSTVGDEELGIDGKVDFSDGETASVYTIDGRKCSGNIGKFQSGIYIERTNSHARKFVMK